MFSQIQHRKVTNRVADKSAQIKCDYIYFTPSVYGCCHDNVGSMPP